MSCMVQNIHHRTFSCNRDEPQSKAKFTSITVPLKFVLVYANVSEQLTLKPFTEMSQV